MSPATGVGVDVVGISAFAAQLGAPGTRFAAVFTPGERRTATSRPHPDASLAARWAAKEAVVKAWSASRFGRADVIGRDHLDWREIEVRSDALGRVAIRLHGAVADALTGHEVLVSLSHDAEADVACAYAVLIPRRPTTEETTA
ncbi:holo-ACP synthase [Nocardioidaceae bacterium]|nr:holo-ACP synthase [Nocardioidaceae bacterium]